MKILLSNSIIFIFLFVIHAIAQTPTRIPTIIGGTQIKIPLPTGEKIFIQTTQNSSRKYFFDNLFLGTVQDEGDTKIIMNNKNIISLKLTINVNNVVISDSNNKEIITIHNQSKTGREIFAVTKNGNTMGKVKLYFTTNKTTNNKKLIKIKVIDVNGNEIASYKTNMLSMLYGVFLAKELSSDLKDLAMLEILQIKR